MAFNHSPLRFTAVLMRGLIWLSWPSVSDNRYRVLMCARHSANRAIAFGLYSLTYLL